MSEEVAVVIPSHKRAGHVVTLKAVSNCTLCVPESQCEEYERAHPGVPIVTHPDTIKGLSLKRQWIYEKWGNVAQIDDDCEGIIRLYDPPSYLDPDVAWEVIQATAYTARQMGCFLFGFAPQASPIAYNSLRPIRLTGRIRGTFIGLLEGGKLGWPFDIDPCDDTFIACINAYYHRFYFGDCRYGTVQAETMRTRGGLAFMRTVDAHRKAADRLVKLFGPEIIHKRKDSGRSRVNRASHDAQITVTFPF